MVSESGLISVKSFTQKQLFSFFRSVTHKEKLTGSCTGLLAFFELSSRTRSSFETAGLEVGIRWASFDPGSSSLQKGESLRESMELFSIYPVQFLVVRHSRAGVCDLIHHWTKKPVLNAGEGCREHPTQALGDAYTLFSKNSQKKWKIAFYGDVVKSRVARSSLQIFKELGYPLGVCDDHSDETHLFARAFGIPLIPKKKISSFDIVYALRTQKERGGVQQLDALRASDLGSKSLVMHAGPVIWGEDIDFDLALQKDRLLVEAQVRACYEVRRKILEQVRKRWPQ